MEKKKIMILGASNLQLPAIKKAKEMGIYTIALDRDPFAVGAKYADEFHQISTVDTEGIVVRATELGVNGIMTMATDMPVRSVAAVGERLGLNTISVQTSIDVTDKARMRERLERFGVPIPKFFSTRSFGEFTEAVNLISGDLVVKPADSSGSRGVYFLRERSNLQHLYDYCRQYSGSGEVIVEEYMSGPEVSVETITIKGTTHFVAITDKETSGPPHFVEVGHSMRSTLPNKMQDEICSVVDKALVALGVDNSPAHSEVIVTRDGPKIVEVGARMGGDYIASHLVPLATGVDMVEACIKLALGIRPSLTPTQSKGAAIRFITGVPGKVKRIEGIDTVCRQTGVNEVFLAIKEGDVVGKVRNSRDRLGHVIFQGETATVAKVACANAVRRIKIEVG